MFVGFACLLLSFVMSIGAFLKKEQGFLKLIPITMFFPCEFHSFSSGAISNCSCPKLDKKFIRKIIVLIDPIQLENPASPLPLEMFERDSLFFSCAL